MDLVPPNLPLIPPGAPRRAASPLLHSQVLCSLHFFFFFMQCQHPSGQFTSFLFGHLQALTKQQRNPQQVLLPHSSQASRALPGAGNAAQPPPLAACPLHATVPLCTAQVPHCATPKQEGASLCWVRSLCPLCLLGAGITQACVPASPSSP